MGDKVEIVGIMNGYDGLINGNYREMSSDEFSGILKMCIRDRLTTIAPASRPDRICFFIVVFSFAFCFCFL